MKMFGLAALAAVASMAMLGAGTASAGPTALCKTHEEPCAADNQLELVHMALTAGTVGRLLSNLATILCLGMLLVAHTHNGKLGNPLGLDVLLAFQNCGTNAAHSNCTKTVLEQPLMLLLRTDLNLGVLGGYKGKPGKVNLHCTILGILIDCHFSLETVSLSVEGALHQGSPTGRGMFTANNALMPLTEPLGAGFLCPQNTTWDALLEPTANHTYIMT